MPLVFFFCLSLVLLLVSLLLPIFHVFRFHFFPANLVLLPSLGCTTPSAWDEFQPQIGCPQAACLLTRRGPELPCQWLLKGVGSLPLAVYVPKRAWGLPWSSYDSRLRLSKRHRLVSYLKDVLFCQSEWYFQHSFSTFFVRI